jgi:RNA polymerase sigma-70 factor (ECF subfamily)
MRSAQAGDTGAYARVLRAMLPAIRACVRRRIYDEALVDDVIQDTLLTVHRLRHTFDPALPMLPWLNAIAATRSIDALRKRGRAQAREVHDDEAVAQAIDLRSTGAADRLAVDQEIRRRLAVLPERQRSVVEMVKLREMSLDDAAVASRTSVSAIKALLHRALENLRKHKMSDHDRP